MGRTINFGCGLRDTTVSHAEFCTREGGKVKERNYVTFLGSHQTGNIGQMAG